MELLRSNWRENRAPMQGPGLAASSESRSGSRATASNTSTSGRRMGGRMTRFAGTTRPSTPLPEFDFDRLRKESPEKYESYVDLEPGVWTKYRIVIDGTKARLFVHGAAQPCLMVNDMKFGDSEGAVALFVGPGTEGYFANLKITQ